MEKLKTKKNRTKWKSQKRLPKILKINRIKGSTISVLFSNGHNRTLDFNEILNSWKVSKKDIEYKLYDPRELKKVILDNYTLSWPNLSTEMDGFDGKKLVLPYQVGADVLYELSEPDEEKEGESIGSLIKKERIKAGLTQEELGERIGSDKFYISRVESNRFHVEMGTLKKIIEAGLHKKLEITIK